MEILCFWANTVTVLLVASALSNCYTGSAWVKLNWLLAVTTVEEIQKFLSTHDERSLKDIGVEEIRRIIPKLLMYSDDHDLTSCKRGLVGVSCYCVRLIVIFIYGIH